MSGSIKVGIYEVPVTDSLRRTFDDACDEMSKDKPKGALRFSDDVQRKLSELCKAFDESEQDEIDMVQTEQNSLELIHYLVEHEVGVASIIPSIRTYGWHTQRLSRRFIIEERVAVKKQVAKITFLEPALVS